MCHCAVDILIMDRFQLKSTSFQSNAEPYAFAVISVHCVSFGSAARASRSIHLKTHLLPLFGEN